MSKTPTLDQIMSTGRSIMDKFGNQGWQKLATQLRRWDSAGLQIPAKYYARLEAEELTRDYRKSGKPNLHLAITSPLILDKNGLHGVITVSPEDLSRVQAGVSETPGMLHGPVLRIVPYLLERGKAGATFRPQLFPFYENGEARITIPLDELNMTPPSQPLPLKDGKLWPVGAYALHVVANDIISVRIPIDAGKKS